MMVPMLGTILNLQINEIKREVEINLLLFFYLKSFPKPGIPLKIVVQSFLFI